MYTGLDDVQLDGVAAIVHLEDDAFDEALAGLESLLELLLGDGNGCLRFDQTACRRHELFRLVINDVVGHIDPHNVLLSMAVFHDDPLS